MLLVGWMIVGSVLPSFTLLLLLRLIRVRLFDQPTSLQRDIVGVREHHRIPNDLLIAIIEGCEMDLAKTRYRNWAELDDYIWKVACAVGLVCIHLFGYRTIESEAYAEHLGRALQLTNILRDVGEDLGSRDRIYLPLEELKRFGLNESDLTRGSADSRFLELMEFQARRAEDFYAKAQASINAADRHALRPARIMDGIYHSLLQQMRADGFRVFEKRYRIGKLGKLFIGLKQLMD